MASKPLKKDEMMSITITLMRGGTLNTKIIRSSEVTAGAHATLAHGMLVRARAHIGVERVNVGEKHDNSK